MISGQQTIEYAVEAMRAGAFDYITKPFDLRHAHAAVRRAFDHHKPDGGVTYGNPAHRRMTGLSPEDTLGTAIRCRPFHGLWRRALLSLGLTPQALCRRLLRRLIEKLRYLEWVSK